MLEKEFLAERLSLCTPSSVWRSQKREAFVAHSVLRGLLLIPYFRQTESTPTSKSRQSESRAFVVLRYMSGEQGAPP